MLRSTLNLGLIIIAIAALLAACTPAAVPAGSPDQAEKPELILATTTSTRDSGLLDELIPRFEAQTGYKVKMIAVGTGQALALGEEGNADVILAHAPAAEMVLMEKGIGKDRLLVMHNDFVLVGPADDPAGITAASDVVDAFTKIASGGVFVSRGDDSGTHKMEINLWKEAGLPDPQGNWYLDTGQGMGDTLRIASEKQGYTLTDRGTYLALRDTLELDILYHGDRALLNIYHVMTINPEQHPAVNYDGAKAFAEFMVAAETQNLIEEFGVEQFGQPLFFPDAGKSVDQLGS